MAGLTSSSAIPVEIRLHRASRELEVAFDDGQRFVLPCEYLRVFSPSAEVQGHGAGQGVLQVGKRNVAITAIDPVGNYAVKLVFDDGHDSGLYSWAYLYELGAEHATRWQTYLNDLAAAGASRDPQ
ncbi:gamma-butyrobetaine hydroxylase-like domain-containing protein [Silvimonas amylolytica]|uniref:Gamma-butyrobetaine hydroxylase-like N-terminal domain-containing protein n=1 Tax=Silvimonas amylolytica TaxID=449663 RepID=A0ABQ2PT07_9NEIS|nr:DUF971 domain-containing protein [Silvimonas amylolytica]GGP28236.1 hypothetical protein GCM10010971_40550 [Silvimonas amylolytica]